MQKKSAERQHIVEYTANMYKDNIVNDLGSSIGTFVPIVKIIQQYIASVLNIAKKIQDCTKEDNLYEVSSLKYGMWPTHVYFNA